MEGWIKLYRSLLDWEWYLDANTLRVFLHLLLKANYEDKRWKGIEIKRGQLITSRGHLAEELNLSERNIRTSLEHLKSTNEIAIKTTKLYTLITIVNYDKFQCASDENDQVTDQQSDQRPTNDRPQHKNIKNNKNIRICTPQFSTQSISNKTYDNLEGLYEN